MSGFVDAHCHLQDKRLAGRAASIVGDARAAGVQTMICCGSEEADWEAVIDICSACPEVVPSFGIHPWYVDGASGGWESRLADRLGRMPSGVGEIGLDFALREYDRDRQEWFFIRQLEIANRFARPVSLHCRRAWGRLIEILGEHTPAAGGLVHAYSGSAELVPVLESLGMYLSFSGTITRSRNRRGHEAVRRVSPARLLIETDSPDLMPVGVAGEVNTPAHLLSVAEAAARLRETSLDEIAALTRGNARRLFRGIMA